MEPPYKREKAANYSMEENMVLYNLYKQNYSIYHSKPENGNRKEGARIRETLLYEWCQILSSLGVARREPSKVAEKIKKDFQTARYMINNYRQQLMNGPSGELIHPRATHPHLIPLFDILEGIGMPTNGSAIAENESVVKPFELRVPDLPRPTSSAQVAITTNRQSEIVIPRVLHPPAKPAESAISKPISVAALTRPADPNEECSALDTSIKKLKKKKLELEIELIEKQIQYQEALSRREFGTQPTTSNSSANSVAPVVAAPTDFSAFFRTFPAAGVKQEQNPFTFQ